MKVEIKFLDCTAEELENLAPFIVQAMQKKVQKLHTAEPEPVPALEPDLPPVEVAEEPAPLQEVPKEPDPQIDLEAVRGVLNKLKQEKGTEAVRKVLEQFNVKRVPDIPAERYIAVLDAVALLYATEEA